MLFQYLLKAEGNKRTINTLVILFTLVVLLFVVPPFLIADAIKFVALMCTVYYLVHHYGDTMMSYLKGDADVRKQDSVPSGGAEAEDRVQES